MNNCGCTKRPVKNRCNNVTLSQKVLADQSGGVLVDDNDVAIGLGLTRTGGFIAFEFQREEEQ